MIKSTRQIGRRVRLEAPNGEALVVYPDLYNGGWRVSPLPIGPVWPEVYRLKREAIAAAEAYLILYFVA